MRLIFPITFAYPNMLLIWNLQNGPLLTDDRLALYDAGHRFQNVPLLLVLLRTLPFTPVQVQLRVLQVETKLDSQVPSQSCFACPFNECCLC